ncbi:hypothetical protein SUGI_0251070 [Cryptomeria japonica]|uniref:uncharacterized protein LOC131029374 n=1 Tax=Cryptomeria japonica TaxID=3369 RepID=UPI002408D0A2|nr:uncharacterized protein LOC131029374 [Cryptomeria japonica]GLJ15312.1 hypothetical protein SUGI_0251070 [Cryptomeria japonica]
MEFNWNNPSKQEEIEKLIQEQSIPSSMAFDSNWYNPGIQLDNIFPELVYANRINQETFADKINQVQNCHTWGWLNENKQEMFADKINQVQNCHTWGSTYLDGGQNFHNLNTHGNNQLQESYFQKGLFNRDSDPNPISDMTRLHVEAFSNQNIQDISHHSGRGHNVESFRKPTFQFPQYTDSTLPSVTWPEVQPFSHKSIQSQPCPQPSGSGLDMEDFSRTSSTWTKVETFSINGIPYQHCPDISSAGGNMEALSNITTQAQKFQDISRSSGGVPDMEPCSNTTIPFQQCPHIAHSSGGVPDMEPCSNNTIPFQQCPHIAHSSGEAPDMQLFFNSRFQTQSSVSSGTTNLDPNQQCLDIERNASIRSKENNKPAMESSKPKQSRIRWSLNETNDLVEYRTEIDEMFKCGKWSQEHLWDKIASKLNSKYTFRHNGLRGKACFKKWSKLLQEVKRLKKEGQTMEGYMKGVECFDGNSNHNPNELAWILEETLNLVLCRKEMDAKFKIFKDNYAGLWEEISRRLKFNQNCDKTPSSCSEKWDRILEEYSASKSKGEPIQGYLRIVETILEKDRSVIINFGTANRKVFIYETATTESIKQAIKWTFGLETSFWLEDEEGIVQPVHSGMPLNKVYSICLSRRPWN